MPEIRPDMSDENRCISVHWSLPMQCVLPSSHRENWHEAWHPETGNRLRYRRSFGNFATEDLHHGEWHDLQIPPPNGFCNEHYPNVPGARCLAQYGHGWSHQVRFNGCLYSWNTPVPKSLTVDQVTRDVQQLRGMLVAAHARIGKLETAEAAASEGALPMPVGSVALSADALAEYAAIDFTELMGEDAAAVVTSMRDRLIGEIQRIRTTEPAS